MLRHLALFLCFWIPCVLSTLSQNALQPLHQLPVRNLMLFTLQQTATFRVITSSLNSREPKQRKVLQFEHSFLSSLILTTPLSNPSPPSPLLAPPAQLQINRRHSPNEFLFANPRRRSSSHRHVGMRRRVLHRRGRSVPDFLQKPGREFTASPQLPYSLCVQFRLCLGRFVVRLSGRSLRARSRHDGAPAPFPPPFCSVEPLHLARPEELVPLPSSGARRRSAQDGASGERGGAGARTRARTPTAAAAWRGRARQALKVPWGRSGRARGARGARGASLARERGGAQSAAPYWGWSERPR